MNLLDGNKIECKRLYDLMVDCIKTDLSWYFKKYNKFVCVLDTKDFASKKYTELKQKTAKECGINIEVINGEKFEKYCDRYNKFAGIIQLPTTKNVLDNAGYYDYIFTDIDYLTERSIIPFISDSKYDDYLLKNPATVKAVLSILDNTIGDLTGKKIAIVGCRSKTVGAYLPQRLLEENATISCYHSRSKIKQNEFEDFDVVISCVGSAGIISKKHFGNKTGCVCIDVGVSRGSDGKIKGDFSEDIRDSQYYTPYVNGVGLLTRIFLMHNYVQYMFEELDTFFPENENDLYILNEKCLDINDFIDYIKDIAYLSNVRKYIQSIKDNNIKVYIKEKINIDINTTEDEYGDIL